MTPAGVIAAGRHGLRVLRPGAGLPGGREAIAEHGKIAEDTAAVHGKTMYRDKWRLVVNVHVAEDDEEALRQVKRAERHETVTYFEETLGRPPGRSDDPLTEGVKMGTTLVGSVETVVRGIEHLQRQSGGGFGGLLFRAHEWATREQTLRSYELFARYVMPRFRARSRPRGSNEVGARQPQDDLQPERRGDPPRVHRCGPRRPGGVQAENVGRPRRVAGSSGLYCRSVARS
jgi:limonene 1,2-monooxygenase